MASRAAEWGRDVLPPFAISRGLLILVTIGLAIIHHASPFGLWDVLDGKWYAGIATHGYDWSLDGKPALAFFPLYPALIHLGIAAGIPAIAAGMVIANACALGALFYARSLALRQWSRSVTRRGLWLIAVFPTAFFTFAPYTEALFLLAAGAVLYHALRGQAVLTGVWLAVAMTTRSIGVILLVPVVMSVLGRSPRHFAAAFGPTVAAAAVYVGFLWRQHLPIGQIVGSEERWHRSLTYPWTGFATSARYLADHATYNAGWTTENLLQVGVTLVFLALTIAAWRSLTPTVAVYCAGFWAVILCTPEWRDGYFAPFSSVDRFILVLFPLGPWVAARLEGKPYRAWLIFSGALMGLAAAVHLSGGWIG